MKNEEKTENIRPKRLTVIFGASGKDNMEGWLRGTIQYNIINV